MKSIFLFTFLFAVTWKAESAFKYGFLTQTHPKVILKTNDKVYYLKKSFLLENRDRIAKGKKQIGLFLKDSKNQRKSQIGDIQVKYSIKKSDILKIKRVPQKMQRKTR